MLARWTRETTGVAAVLLLALGLVSCDRRPVSMWERPWECWRNKGNSYSCAALEQTWSEWKQAHAEKAAIAHSCVSSDFDVELNDEDELHSSLNPADFLCEPQFSPALVKMDDETAPRFHCLGTHDPDSDYVGFHCKPYWELKPRIRKRSGSGWFLWLALQAPTDEERDQLMATANQIAEGEAQERASAQTQHRTAEPTPNLQEIRANLKRIKDERERAKTPPPAEELRRRIDEERKAWERHF
jgi:hypothetical protein